VHVKQYVISDNIQNNEIVSRIFYRKFPSNGKNQKSNFHHYYPQAAPELVEEVEVTEKYRALLCVSQAFFCYL